VSNPLGLSSTILDSPVTNTETYVNTAFSFETYC
jgi:hypothetical protein